ncbi:hypothetical protein JQX08_00435 [Pseudomonas sp. UL073]|uniref:Uncharacterized protein n=1 Tax=Zestomonas insulae TaxID=2809017 RepID=A0ABS2I7P2_9GAMM|nr:hypothetical protein [Pseudomonas insulae]MBM7059166.1 hypothetical protein [Pseudomonas insulae]
MKTTLTRAIPALLLAAACCTTAMAAQNLAEFKGGIGVIPVSSAPGPDLTATSVTRNIVRGVQPPGQIWLIDKLEARVRADGRIKVEGEGLILGGGNSVGIATGQRVFATLICEAAAPFVLSNSDVAGVLLTASGDFSIDDVLSPTPAAPCPSPVLLIRNAANGSWFAAGIPKLPD